MAAAEHPFRHHLTLCAQHRIEGWTTAPVLTLAVNDAPIARITPGPPSPGPIPARAFATPLPYPLWVDDVVSLHGPDGSTTRRHLDPESAARIRQLTRFADPSRRRGLEIGPLDRPLIPKTRFRVAYLDHADKAELARRYASPGVHAPLLVEPDFTLGDKTFLEVLGARRFGYAIASHVIEHVPDMIGWLWQIWSVLDDGAVLSLAIPHAQKIFDARRRLTTFADLVEPYFNKATRPTARPIIDAALGSALFHNTSVVEAAYKSFHLANYARKSTLYADTHCHVFTPESFTEILRCLDRCELLGYDPLALVTLSDEFIVHLARRAGKSLAGHISP